LGLVNKGFSSALPSFLRAKERVIQRSADRVSNVRAILTPTQGANALADYLLTPTTLRWSTLSPASRKEGKDISP